MEPSNEELIEFIGSSKRRSEKASFGSSLLIVAIGNIIMAAIVISVSLYRGNWLEAAGGLFFICNAAWFYGASCRLLECIEYEYFMLKCKETRSDGEI